MNRSLHLVPPGSAVDGEGAPSALPPGRRPGRLGRRLLFGVVFALLGAGAMAVGRAVWRRTQTQKAAQTLFAPLTAGAFRTSEARFSHPLADRHRPLAETAGNTRAPLLSASAQARLEQLGQVHAVAVSFALGNENAQARGRLLGLPSSPDVLSDLAATALDTPATFDDALVQLERALKDNPRHPQALWNRGVVLAKLGLELGAAQAFAAVAARGEPGWASEAQTRADALTTQAAGRRARWHRADGARRQLIEARLLPGPELVADAPDWMRDGFYAAMQRAPGAAELRALAPLARALDSAYGEDTLERALERAVRAATPARAEAVRQSLALGVDATPAQIDVVVRGARAAGADDVAIAALSRTRWVAPARELSTLVEASGDPWLLLLAQERSALAAALADDYVSAERILEDALGRCRPSRLRYRCALLLLKLADVHGWTHRVQPAIAALSEARAIALEGSFLPLFVRATGQLGTQESYRDAHGMANAFANETVLWGEPCAEVQEARHYLADTALEEHDFLQARRLMAAVERCPDRPARFGLAGAGVLSELYRDKTDGWAEAKPWLDEALAAVRSSPVRSPPRLAFATMLEGQAIIERQPAEGRVLLRRAIDEVAALPRPTVLGDKVRALSYVGLIGDATAHGDPGAALRLTLELERMTDPGGCLVAVTHHFVRTAAVARGQDGKLVGHWNPRSTGAPSAMVLPAELKAKLVGCREIPVLATAPVLGAAHLLPSDWAWAYLATSRPAASPRTGTRRRLVVSDVTSPWALHLPPLRRWHGATRPQEPTIEETVDLHGDAATPSAVLAAMADADVVELHVHGIRNRQLTDAAALVLSAGKDESGKAFLTPSDIAKVSLARHPLVLLGACQAAQNASYGPLASSLPSALLQAGASLVLASPAPVSDADAGQLLDEFQARLAAGARPAVALREVRAPILAKDPAHWSGELVLFE